jgi:hypothetical protein
MQTPPPSRYKVVERHGRLIVYVDNIPVDGFARAAPHNAVHMNMTAPVTADTSPVTAAATSAINQRISANAPRSAPATRPASTTSRAPRQTANALGVSGQNGGALRSLGGIALSIVTKGRDNNDRRVIRRTIDHKPHDAHLLADQEERLLRHAGMWLLAVLGLIFLLPFLFPFSAIGVFLLFKWGWPMLFSSVPKDQWLQVT